MRELSLFSGAGGGLLASKLLGWTTIGYVEKNPYCQRVLAARIADGLLDAAPIFGDIRAFIDQGYAERYRGLADVVSGGFPCQPFSVAGRQLAGDDDRNLWPETLDVLRVVRPRFAFLENVANLLNGSHGYFGIICADLASLGYDLRWAVLSAADLGAPHLRKRLWIVASGAERVDLRHKPGRRRWANREDPAEPSNDGEASCMADADSDAKLSRAECQDNQWPGCESERGGFQPKFKGSGEHIRVYNWWTTEPDVGRVAHGVASRMDRLRALGNGQVPIVAATAWQLLTEETGGIE